MNGLGYSVWGLLVLVGDIWAIINIFQSSVSNEKKLIWIIYLAERWKFPTMLRRKLALRKKTRTDRARKESGSRLFCMARDLRALANAI